MTPHEEMRQIFFESASELLQKLNDEALRLEANPMDHETAREIRRIVHTIKGDSAVLGFSALTDLAHELEDVLAPGTMVYDASLAEVVLSAADMFDAILAAYQGGFEPPSADPLRAMIWKLAQRPAPAASTAPTAMQPKFSWSVAERFAAEEAISKGQTVFNIAIRFATECPMRTAGAELLHKTFRECGEILACAPGQVAWPDSECIEAALVTSLDEESLSAKLFIPGVTSNLVVQHWPSFEAAQPRLRKTEENLLRVDAGKIEAVLDLVGELVIGKSMLQQAITDFAQRYPKDPLRPRFADALSFQSQALRVLQRAAMSIRMVPVEQLFRGFSRVVRDLARSCGKQVSLETCGQDTELDKALVDALAEPLGHIVRNAVDHGIETPEERRATGKPETGKVRLNAYHEGNQMVIEVSDDGRGVDRAAILRRAVEKGMITAEQADRFDPSEIVDLIFEPGFSTAGHVTAISGRGVGMDVVKAAVLKMKGTVVVESEPGKGSTVRITLPLTLAIMRSMLFRVGGQLYATPMDAVGEIRRVQEQEFTRAGNREVLQVRDELVTVVRLQRMNSARTTDDAKTFVLILNLGQRKFALTVDTVVGEQELVIKPLDEKAIASTLVSGASVLGDGTVALVLNIEEAIRQYAVGGPLAPPPTKTQWGATA